MTSQKTSNTTPKKFEPSLPTIFEKNNKVRFGDVEILHFDKEESPHTVCKSSKSDETFSSPPIQMAEIDLLGKNPITITDNETKIKEAIIDQYLFDLRDIKKDPEEVKSLKITEDIKNLADAQDGTLLQQKLLDRLGNAVIELCNAKACYCETKHDLSMSLDDRKRAMSRDSKIFEHASHKADIALEWCVKAGMRIAYEGLMWIDTTDQDCQKLNGMLKADRSKYLSRD